MFPAPAPPRAADRRRCPAPTPRSSFSPPARRAASRSAPADWSIARQESHPRAALSAKAPWLVKQSSTRRPPAQAATAVILHLIQVETGLLARPQIEPVSDARDCDFTGRAVLPVQHAALERQPLQLTHDRVVAREDGARAAFFHQQSAMISSRCAMARVNVCTTSTSP